MKIHTSSSPPLQTKADLLAIACDEDALADSAALNAIDEALGGVLRRAMQDERFRGKAGQTLVLHTHGRAASQRIALLGVGPRGALRPSAMKSFAARAVRLANGAGAASLALAPSQSLVGAGSDAQSVAQALAEGVLLGGYKFDKYLSEEKRSPRPLTEAFLLVGDVSRDALRRGSRVAAAVARARDLVNEPAAALTPSRFAQIAEELAAEHHLEGTVLGPAECRARGMNLYLAVSQGSVEEPRFIHLAWKPPGASRRIVIVGKGVTFDSGGLSLKPNDGMLDMKTDMAGAAAVISVIAAVAEEKLPVEVHAIAACTENMPSGSAYKLGDVIRSKAGKTIEINNTDAEGRLTLADALAYGLELQPDAIFDFATLTGACVVALGPHIAGVMSNNDALAKEFLDAAKEVGEEMWRLPLPDALLDQLKSEIADMKNTGERWGGALTAGLFLREFVREVPWVHVDLAGPSSADKEQGYVTKGGTGFAVATIFEYLRRVSLQ